MKANIAHESSIYSNSGGYISNSLTYNDSSFNRRKFRKQKSLALGSHIFFEKWWCFDFMAISELDFKFYLQRRNYITTDS